MIARLRARLHGLRRGHQVYEDNETSTYALAAEEYFQRNYPGLLETVNRGPHRRYLCHGCDRRWIA